MSSDADVPLQSSEALLADIARIQAELAQDEAILDQQVRTMASDEAALLGPPAPPASAPPVTLDDLARNPPPAPPEGSTAVASPRRRQSPQPIQCALFVPRGTFAWRTVCPVFFSLGSWVLNVVGAVSHANVK